MKSWLTIWKRIWERKPAEIFHVQQEHQELERTYELKDLLAVGIGGTIGSGVFVLCGLIARDYAGPAVILSWLMAGVACIFSGLAYAEMSTRIPSAGSSYAYAFHGLGELPAMIAGWCLTLEYGLSASAVARSWGDKIIEWWTDSLNLTVWAPFDPGYSVNIFAGIIQTACVLLLLRGAEVGKFTVNLFTVIKIILVIFMIIAGFSQYNPSNMKPFLPKGVSGATRGATSAFFGYLGYDEVCCMAGEAKNPKKTLATAVVGSIIGVTILSVLAAWALVGMENWEDIDEDDGFTQAFKHSGLAFAQQITAVGELVCLPLVVLVSFLAQPRLLYAMSEDKLLPAFFSKVDKNGNLFKATLVSGIACIIVAVFVPFTFLNDMISAGVLISFNMTNSALIIIRQNKHDDPGLSRKLTGVFNLFCMIAVFLFVKGTGIAVYCFGSIFGVASIAVIISIYIFCPEFEQCSRDSDITSDFRVPLVPWWPAIAITLNWFMIAQLDWLALYLVCGYIGLAIVFYFCYSIHQNPTWSQARISFDSVVSEKTVFESQKGLIDNQH